jgi:pyruvate/2-oxoglutarate dehydrogenase complex dihydrolipoamide acyltransferase (E2) component
VTVGEWLKKDGDMVTREESICTLLAGPDYEFTGRIELELPSPEAGRIQGLRVTPGSEVRNGDELATIELLEPIDFSKADA